MTILHNKDLRRSIDKANEMADFYELEIFQGKSFPRSVASLHELVEEYLQQKIPVYEFKQPTGAETILGAFILNENGPAIYVQPNLPSEMRRMVQCKELFHALFTDEEYQDTNILDHVKSMVVPLPEKPHRVPPARACEAMAEIAAIEFLFPYKERKMQRDLGKGLDFAKIAQYYDLPQLYVERYLSDEWMGYIGALYNEKDQLTLIIQKPDLKIVNDTSK